MGKIIFELIKLIQKIDFWLMIQRKTCDGKTVNDTEKAL